MEAPSFKFLPKNECFLKTFHYFRIKYTEEKKCINRIILLVIRIAEKLGFMKVRALEVYTKAEIGRKTRHIKPCSCASFQQGGFESDIS